MITETFKFINSTFQNFKIRKAGPTGPAFLYYIEKAGHHYVPVCIGWTGVRRMNACEVTASVTALANTLACQMTNDELNLLGVILTQLGDTILTIAAHREICGGK